MKEHGVEARGCVYGCMYQEVGHLRENRQLAPNGLGEENFCVVSTLMLN